MRLLIVFCHPSLDSYGAALFERVKQTLEVAGHELRIRDLYREGFDPVLSLEEWQDYLAQPDANYGRQRDHIADLQWAEGLVVIYPTWYYGPPAMLKGWLEKVWLPGISFEIPRFKGDRPRPKLRHIRVFVGITTSGSPWWWLRLIRDPGRSLWLRGLRPLFARNCRVIWRQLHSMNNSSDHARARFLDRVEASLKKI
ncbi:MAG: NAD(P)H-dependent oxidoreductase [Pararhodobacter sp.]|nr:NAD(P)H-dependent oxidoreductase [Pararhodobacter sp.]